MKSKRSKYNNIKILVFQRYKNYTYESGMGEIKCQIYAN